MCSLVKSSLAEINIDIESLAKKRNTLKGVSIITSLKSDNPLSVRERQELTTDVFSQNSLGFLDSGHQTIYWGLDG